MLYQIIECIFFLNRNEKLITIVVDEKMFKVELKFINENYKIHFLKNRR